MRQTKKRNPPKRPHAPNTKGLEDAEDMEIKLPRSLKAALRNRAAYETMKARLQGGGRGRSVSAGDIARRAVGHYFTRVSALPDDTIGAAVRALYPDD